jgi:small GTP-binding protein
VLQRKVCVLGAFGVGKTSLVRRYVESIFSDAYLTTVGVKLSKKVLEVGGQPLTLLLWDVAGEDDTTQIRMSYLRGAAAYFLVADGTRPETLDVARFIQARVTAEVGELPYLVILNKADLQADWELPEAVEGLAGAVAVIRASAKTGDGVEQSFQELAQRLIA